MCFVIHIQFFSHLIQGVVQHSLKWHQAVNPTLPTMAVPNAKPVVNGSNPVVRMGVTVTTTKNSTHILYILCRSQFEGSVVC